MALKYGGLLKAIEVLHLETAGKAVAAINRRLIIRNWLIGAYLVEFEHNGEGRVAYGQGLLSCLSVDLRSRGIKSANPDLLERMRVFFQRYRQFQEQISAPAVRNMMKSISIGGNALISAPLVRKSESKAPAPLKSGLRSMVIREEFIGGNKHLTHQYEKVTNEKWANESRLKLLRLRFNEVPLATKTSH